MPCYVNIQPCPLRLTPFASILCRESCSPHYVFAFRPLFLTWHFFPLQRKKKRKKRLQSSIQTVPYLTLLSKCWAERRLELYPAVSGGNYHPRPRPRCCVSIALGRRAMVTRCHQRSLSLWPALGIHCNNGREEDVYLRPLSKPGWNGNEALFMNSEIWT